jgi:predicted PurR-regulated permease PerM
MKRRPRQMRSRGSGGERGDAGRTSTPVIIFIAVVLSWLLYEFRIVLLPFLISGIAAYICTPLVTWLSFRTDLSRAFFSVAAFVILLSIVAILGFFALPAVLRGLTHLGSDFQGIITSLTRSAVGDRNINVLGQSMNASQIAQAIASATREWIEQPGKILLLGGAAFAGVFGTFLTATLLFYFLYSGPHVLRGMLWLVPPDRRPLVIDIWSKLDPVLRRYFLGVFVVAAYTATAAYIGLGVILHIPHAVFLALLTSFLEMIPVFGPLAAAIIAGLVAVHYATGIGAIIGYTIYAIALRLSIDQLFGPLALGTAARLHPVVIIFCFIAGAALFGIAGVIVAVPVAVGIRTCLTVLYEEPRRREETRPE